MEDPYCHIYVPISQAHKATIDGQDLYFCSERCLEKYTSEHSTKKAQGAALKFFIDSANINEIKEGISLGMVDGVTTNPSLIAKEKRGFEEVVKEILEVVDGPVSLELSA